MTDQPTLPDDPLGLKKDEPAAGIGHNMPPAFDQNAYDELVDRVDAFLEVSDKWKPVPIETEEKASLLNDQIAGLRKLHASVEAERVKQKKPHDDQAQAVQDAFKPQLDRITAAANTLKPKLNDYATLKQKRLDEEAARKKAEADKIAAEAAAKAEAAAQTASIDEKLEAEAAQKEAEAAQKEAAKAAKEKANIGSATGAARTYAKRKIKTARINNIRQLFLHYQANPKVVDLLQSLANAEVRAAKFDGTMPPGTTLIEE